MVEHFQFKNFILILFAIVTFSGCVQDPTANEPVPSPSPTPAATTQIPTPSTEPPSTERGPVSYHLSVQNNGTQEAKFLVDVTTNSSLLLKETLLLKAQESRQWTLDVSIPQLYWTNVTVLSPNAIPSLNPAGGSASGGATFDSSPCKPNARFKGEYVGHYETDPLGGQSTGGQGTWTECERVDNATSSTPTS